MKTKRLHLLFLLIGILSVAAIIIWIIDVAQEDPPIQETSMQDLDIEDFDALHTPVDGDTNTYLVFGNLPISEPAADLQPELAAFSVDGRVTVTPRRYRRTGRLYW